jgi:YHS domain-containing protein
MLRLKRTVIRSLRQWLLATACVLGATMAFANEAMPVAVDKNGVAVRGYDPVAYFIDKRAVKGKEKFAVKTDDGVIYYFSSLENREIFVADPARYAPQFGGFCALGAAQGARAQSDPKSFRVVDGKLYFISDPKNASKWSKDASNFILRANERFAPTAQK